MSVLGAIGAGILGTFQAGVPQFAYSIYQDQRDTAYRNSVFDYEKALQKEMFQREDNAVQRRRADLEAAGINPNLAAGQAASAGPVVATSGSSSSRNLPPTDVLSSMVQFQLAKQEIQSAYEDLQTRRMANFYRKAQQIFDAGQSDNYYVNGKGELKQQSEFMPRRGKNESFYIDGDNIQVMRNGKYDSNSDYWIPFKNTEIYKKLNNQQKIMSNDAIISGNDAAQSIYDTENYSLDRWVDRVSEGIGSVTDLVDSITGGYRNVESGKYSKKRGR